MNFYAVIDTNVLISALLKKTSIPGRVLDYVFSEIITPVLNKELLDEYREVMSRNKFGFNKSEIDFVLSVLESKSLFFDRTKTFEEFIDQDDIVFYEIVLSARSKMNTYLVTGNLKHFPNKPFIVAPKEMVEIVEKEIKILSKS